MTDFDPHPRTTAATPAVLAVLLDHDDKTLVDQLAAATAHSPAEVGLAVWALLDAGWLTSTDTGDRRAYALTPDARPAARQLLEDLR